MFKNRDEIQNDKKSDPFICFSCSNVDSTDTLASQLYDYNLTGDRIRGSMRNTSHGDFAVKFKTCALNWVEYLTTKYFLTKVLLNTHFYFLFGDC